MPGQGQIQGWLEKGSEHDPCPGWVSDCLPVLWHLQMSGHPTTGEDRAGRSGHSEFGALPSTAGQLHPALSTQKGPHSDGEGDSSQLSECGPEWGRFDLPDFICSRAMAAAPEKAAFI